ncbi:hypothetical protein E4U91_35675 [Streptomyces lasalocidi]|uniref:Uncharacterized protein n=1 Tax=Streptomyces lasalocidi TaxID=324833 RepID=A0A4U5W4K0_STRLS|nr:hypothetical protein E4U91_35675 [Streptomyces lasalocidi]
MSAAGPLCFLHFGVTVRLRAVGVRHDRRGGRCGAACPAGQAGVECFPRPRGWSRLREGRRGPGSVLPAPAGMVPSGSGPSAPCRGLGPRTAGATAGRRRLAGRAASGFAHGRYWPNLRVTAPRGHPGRRRRPLLDASPPTVREIVR